MKISTAYFRLKAEQLRTKSRLLALVNDIGCVVIVSALAFGFSKFPPVSRVGAALLAAGYIYAVVTSHRRLRSGNDRPLDGVQSYVTELRRSRDESRQILRILGPLLPGCLLFAAPYVAAILDKARVNPKILVNATPFCVLLLIWMVMVIPVRRRRLRNIDQELEELEHLK